MLRSVADTYPQPVAEAYGRLDLALTPTVRLDAVLRCAEVVTRYLAALGIASFASREDAGVTPPPSFGVFRGPLAFGHFLAVAKETARLGTRHPIQSYLSQSLAQKSSPLEGHLDLLVRLRNHLGHDLRGVDEGRAERTLAGEEPDFLEGQRPETMLEEALRAAAPVCELPLVYLNGVAWADTGFVAVCYLLMGRGEPAPQSFPVQNTPPFPKTRQLYVATWDGLLSLHPKLVWDYEPARSTRGVYLLDEIGESALGYRAVAFAGAPAAPPPSDDLVGILEGSVTRPAYELRLEDGRRLDEAWGERREAILSGRVGLTRPVEWDAFDGATLAWYDRLLRARHALGPGPPAAHVRQVLLDGRGEVTEDEHRQLRILFGKPADVKRELGRAVVDLRARASEEGRWDAREEVEANVITALQRAVHFVAHHNADVGEGLEAEGLQATVGSADYVAVREALVNLLVHQDYDDARAAGQVELVPHRTTLVNPGHSLVPEEEIFEGGNLSRNPLIARALKLIGFAELAGSGLRELARAWRQAGRRRPEVHSDAETNRFRIALDSREVESMTDGFWKERAGVEVTPGEARLLGVLGQVPAGLTAEAVAERSGVDPGAAAEALERLCHQRIVEDHGDRYRLKPRFVEVARAAEGR